MSDIEQRLREAHPISQQYANGSKILLEAADEITRLQAENEALRAREAKLVEALEAFMDIVHDSGGVAGYHLNGAVAEWDEFQDVHDAAAALAAHRKKGSE